MMNRAKQAEASRVKNAGGAGRHYWIAAFLLITSQGGIILAAIGDGWMDLLGSALLAPSCIVLLVYLARAGFGRTASPGN